ncbi:phage tail assembly protein [uncultured Shewanella sp.]|uniref:phage tail assembly protein n=1 Tax=uncultured Shewanella sp. TaxID=173975 RepID=UPI002629DB5D|nr:phage tail assembly protein [uncultured Shewanella sp.]
MMNEELQKMSELQAPAFEHCPHVLHWPIEDDKGKLLEQIKIKTITMATHQKLTQQYKGQDLALLHACMSASTGLTTSELERLVTPDYNSVQTSVLALMQKTASCLQVDQQSDDNEIDATEATKIAPKKSDFNVNQPALLVAIQGDDGELKQTYRLRPPTVRTTILMDTHQNEWDRTLFISASCSGLSREELGRLSLPDWNQLQERLIDFLQQPADFFRRETLKC